MIGNHPAPQLAGVPANTSTCRRAATRGHAHSAADEMDQTSRNDRIGRIPSSEVIDELVDIVDELVRRLGSDEVGRQLGVSLDEFQAFIEAARAGLADERRLDA